MAQETLDIPVSELPFDAGEGFFATVSKDGIAHITISVDDPKGQTQKTISAGDAFLQKWGGTLTPHHSFRKEDHGDDPRMLSYIEKYGLDA